MSVPVWPSNIPHMPMQDSYTLALSDGENIATTDMDNGEKRYRQRFNRSIAPASLTIEMTAQEVGLFKLFWRDTLKNGIYWFDMPIWDGEKYKTCLVRIDNGNQPKIKAKGYNHFEVTLDLAVRNLF